MTNGNDLAHPTNIIDPEQQFAPEYHTGLTKREYFAAMALQGLLTRVPNRPNNETDLGVIELKRISEESVIMADALINALNEPSC